VPKYFIFLIQFPSNNKSLLEITKFLFFSGRKNYWLCIPILCW